MLLAKTIETTGIVNNRHLLLLDESLPITKNSRVRVMVIVTEELQITKSQATLKPLSELECAKTKQLQKQQDILKNINIVWNEENVKLVEQTQQEINQWKIQTF
jgi:hypothetical protein